MKGSLIYTLKIWLLALVIAPVIQICYYSVADHHTYKYHAIFRWMETSLVMSFVFSLPSYFLFWLATFLLAKERFSMIAFKSLLSAVCILLFILAFVLLNAFFSDGLIGITTQLPYAIVIILGVWLFKIDRKNSTSDN